MSTLISHPTILVKRSDGTTARMSLDEIRNLKKQATSGQAQKIPHGIPLIIRPKAPQPPLPKSQPLKKVESLLDEKLEDKELLHPATVGDVSYQEILAKIVRDSGVTFPEGLARRSQSLMLSYLKGVRDGRQFIEYATKTVETGGLGLEPRLAERIVKAMQKYIGAQNPNQIKTGIEIGDEEKTKIKNEIKEFRAAGLPMKKINESLATTTPVKDIFVDEARAEIVKKSKSISTILQDVQTTTKHDTIMGPTEEMRTFKLSDWRRLGAKPQSAANTLIGKFKSWREESFLLYLDTKQAWLESPLMAEYRRIIAAAVNGEQSISGIIAESGQRGVTEEEFREIIRVNKEFV